MQMASECISLCHRNLNLIILSEFEPDHSVRLTHPRRSGRRCQEGRPFVNRKQREHGRSAMS